MIIITFIFSFIILSYSGSAFAYLDPGFASMIFQSIAAFFALLLSLVSIFYYKIKFFLQKIFNYIKSKVSK